MNPTVVLPRSSSSPEVIVTDLGTISIYNRFESVPATQELVCMCVYVL